MKRATLRELKQDEATAKRIVRNLRKQHREEIDCVEANRIWNLVVDAKAMLRNISQAIKRREKEKRA